MEGGGGDTRRQAWSVDKTDSDMVSVVICSMSSDIIQYAPALCAYMLVAIR